MKNPLKDSAKEQPYDIYLLSTVLVSHEVSYDLTYVMHH